MAIGAPTAYSTVIFTALAFVASWVETVSVKGGGGQNAQSQDVCCHRNRGHDRTCVSPAI